MYVYLNPFLIVFVLQGYLDFGLRTT